MQPRFSFLLSLLALFLMVTVINAQSDTDQENSEFESINQVFTTEDTELQREWYEGFMDKLGLEGQKRKIYRQMVIYHSIKMELLDRANNPLGVKEIRVALEKQIASLNEDVAFMLNEEQLEKHREVWKRILNATMSRIE